MTRAVIAAVIAAGHGPARNPWWVNVILLVVIVAVLFGWRRRVLRRRRSAEQDHTGLGRRS
jgi:membrane protein implicated in regulation of membrane protease activity